MSKTKKLNVFKLILKGRKTMTMKQLMKIFFLSLAVLFFISSASVYAKEIKQQKCPIMGYKPSERLFVDYKGKRIYFCCGSCPSTFLKEPDKYMEKMKLEGIFLEDSPTAQIGASGK